jgi:adenylate cyclase
MFVDLRNFSAYCEGRDPADAATVLHLFYTTVDGLVRQSGGVVEQVVGDSVMAVWNGSTPCADHAQRAVAVAEVIWRDCVAQLPRTASRSVPPLDVGIGIESGSVMVGSFGPARRRVHSVMGEAVTVASRLEGLTAELAYPVLLGPQVVVRSGNAQVKPLGDFLLAGLSQPRKVHALPIDVGPQYLRLVYDIEQDRAVGP